MELTTRIETDARGGFKIESSYLGNKKHGQQTWYNTDGSLFAKQQYVNGERSGLCSWYNSKTGIVTDKEFYINGLCVGIGEYFSKDGLRLKINTRNLDDLHGVDARFLMTII